MPAVVADRRARMGRTRVSVATGSLRRIRSTAGYPHYHAEKRCPNICNHVPALPHMPHTRQALLHSQAEEHCEHESEPGHRCTSSAQMRLLASQPQQQRGDDIHRKRNLDSASVPGALFRSSFDAAATCLPRCTPWSGQVFLVHAMYQRRSKLFSTNFRAPSQSTPFFQHQFLDHR